MIFKKLYIKKHPWVRDENRTYFDIMIHNRNCSTLIKDNTSTTGGKHINIVKVKRHSTEDDGLKLVIVDRSQKDDYKCIEGVIDANRKIDKSMYEKTTDDLKYVKHVILKNGYDYDVMCCSHYIELSPCFTIPKEAKVTMNLSIMKNNNNKRFFRVVIQEFNKLTNKIINEISLNLTFSDISTMFEPIIQFWEGIIGEEL
jgi:hypothetical protein